MYPHQGQTNPDQPGHPHQGHSQPAPQQPQQQQYPPQQQQQGRPIQQPHPGYGGPPPPLNPNRPEMAAIHPTYPYEMPRLPAPPMPQYYPHPGPYQMPPQQQPAGSNQTAPRQRTAIACKYCRRRKIRCSGFEQAADGRCSNCARFNQECVFTPVSAQAQAFVPAQALYGPRGARGAQPQILFGPYGQPVRNEQAYAQYGLPPPPPQGNPPPPGQGYYQPYGQPGYPPPYPQHYEQPPPQQTPLAGPTRRRRPSEEPHTPTLPPPNPGHAATLSAHDPQHQQQQPYMYPPDQAGYAPSPAVSQQAYPPAAAYYPAQSQRTSPGSAYSYEQPRGSNSPHNQAPYYGGQAPLQAQPQAAPTQAGRTPPPHQDGRNGLAIRDIVSDSNVPQGQGERTAADTDMVQALNRTSRR